MVCKYCNAEFDESEQVCPVCGKDLLEETAVETAVETAEEKEEKRWKLAAKIFAAVLSLTVLSVLLLLAMGVELLPRPNTISKKDNYTVSAEKAQKKADVVVATMGGKELTNAELMLRYRSYAMYYVNNNISNLKQMGLDYEKPLNEQKCTLEDYKDYTWQQYLLEKTLDSWKEETISVLKAEKEGYTLSEESQKELEKFPETLAQQAQSQEYESADAMLKELFGPGCTQELYMEYIRVSVYAEEYFYHCAEKLTPNDSDSEAYFDENVATFEEMGIKKDSGLYASVRHILIVPEGGVLNEETGLMDYTEEEWAAGLAAAEAVLETWKSGEATEESFAELVKTHTKDTGSLETGGLYEDVYFAANYVEEFKNWAIDETRKPGDTDIVKTYFGYHIMYFVSGEPAWLIAARNELHTKRIEEISVDTAGEWPAEIQYGKIVLAELVL